MKLEKRKSCHLKIKLDLPPEVAKCIARLVKMNNNALRNYGRKPCRLGSLKWCFLQLTGIRWQIHITHGLCRFRHQDATMSLETMSLEIGKWLLGATSIISLTHCSCLGTM